MSPRTTAALMRHNITLLAADPGPVIVTTLMPLVLMTFLQGMGESVLRGDGYTDATGAEHVVPGMAVLFSLFGVVTLGMVFFQEHGWGTWERLRASPARPLEILIGKMLPAAVLVLLQGCVLITAGVVVLGLEIAGSVVAMAMLLTATTAFTVALSMACVAVFRTINQLSAAANVGAMVLGGLGGALAPVSALPDWAQRLAPLSPAYWAMEGFQSVILEGGGIGSIAWPLVILAGSTLLLGAVAARRFRFGEEKVWM